MHLEETETGNDCSGEGQQQFSRPTDGAGVELTESYSHEEREAGN
jgi:hypothetical protein